MEVESEVESEADKQQVSLADLAVTFLKIGTIGFGGGMAIIALMERELVRKRHVIRAEEFLHGVGLSQSRARKTGHGRGGRAEPQALIGVKSLG